MKKISLSDGGGGKEMQELIREIQKYFPKNKSWKHINNDSASIKIGNKQVLFTTDSYVVTPIFFPGGDIAKLAFCGTVNDLAVMGAKPLGISLSLVIEEGFPRKDLDKLMLTLGQLSRKTKIPIVTGDTKVMERNSIDKIIINTSGIGVADKVLDQPLSVGDKIIVSGGIGEHGATLLAKRFGVETNLISDCKPLWDEINSVKSLIKQAKDITRGGLAAILNELASKQFLVKEEKIPVNKQVKKLTKLLGIEPYTLACEGRFICIVPNNSAPQTLSLLKKYNNQASIIGEVKTGKSVILQTRFGKRFLPMPSGKLVPRIC